MKNHFVDVLPLNHYLFIVYLNKSLPSILAFLSEFSYSAPAAPSLSDPPLIAFRLPSTRAV